MQCALGRGYWSLEQKHLSSSRNITIVNEDTKVTDIVCGGCSLKLYSCFSGVLLHI